MQNITSDKYALTNDDLKSFCNLNNIPYQLETLQNLDKTDLTQAFVHTGEKKDEKNKGNTNHWLYLINNHIFDSYGDPKAFVYPSDIIPFPNKRYQKFGTNVCGPYVAAFCDFINTRPEDQKWDPKEIISEFEDFFKLTNNHEANDESIQAWFNQRDKRPSK